MKPIQDRKTVQDIYRKSVLIDSYYRSAVTDAMASTARELGIEGKTKFAQYFVLCELYHKHEATLTEIADAISVAIPNVSNTAAELIELGLAERASDSGDRRKSIIRITPEGLRFSEIIIPRCLDIANTVGGDEDEAQQLLNHYDVVLKRIEQHKAGRSIE